MGTSVTPRTVAPGRFSDVCQSPPASPGSWARLCAQCVELDRPGGEARREVTPWMVGFPHGWSWSVDDPPGLLGAVAAHVVLLEHLLKGRAALSMRSTMYWMTRCCLSEREEPPSRPKRRCQKDCLSLILVADSFA
jgi:hypothetical protein